ncbi:RluA family pseudouridine synthase [Marinomonas agarivorans]|nr:RluA family pseudouridine synthase [Marinomonas agarivorans]
MLSSKLLSSEPSSFEKERNSARNALDILYEDEWFAVINKAANFLSVPGKGADKQDCVIHRAVALLDEAYTVHRLDYATSGLLLIAKQMDTQRRLSEQFQQRSIKKEYRAIVQGHIKGSHGQICKPLICDWPNRPKQIVHMEWGKTAITQWQCLAHETTPNGKAQSRLALYPVTGRSHQLRVHMQSIHHAIIGDEFYQLDYVNNEKDDENNKKRNKKDTHSKKDTADRLLLHAYRLEFSHPVTKAWVTFIAPCPF